MFKTDSFKVIETETGRQITVRAWSAEEALVIAQQQFGFVGYIESKIID